jgi:hypothetical protein
LRVSVNASEKQYPRHSYTSKLKRSLLSFGAIRHGPSRSPGGHRPGDRLGPPPAGVETRTQVIRTRPQVIRTRLPSLSALAPSWKVRHRGTGQADSIFTGPRFVRFAPKILQKCEDQASSSFDGFSCPAKNLMCPGRHRSYLACRPGSLRDCGFCQRTHAIEDLPGVEPALTRKLLPIAATELIAPNLTGDFLCQILRDVLPNLATHNIVHRRERCAVAAD